MTVIQKKVDEERFEFVLHINNKIVCQRFFDIRKFNEESVKSIEIKELMDILVGMNTDNIGSMGLIPTHLKSKSVDYIWDSYNPYYVRTEESVTPTYKENTFQFEIKVDKVTVAKSQFSGSGFLSSKVDIKEIIPTIIYEIRNYLSRKTYSKKYMDVTW